MIDAAGSLAGTVKPDRERSRQEQVDEGAARYRQLREAIGSLSATILADIDPDDVAVALDVLRRVAARAESMR